MRPTVLVRDLFRRLGWRLPWLRYAWVVVRQTPDAVRLARDPVRGKTYFPSHPRKGRLRIVADNVVWLARNGELCDHYFAHGLDRKGTRLGSVLPYGEFRRIRDVRNRKASPSEDFDYLCLLRDKFIFGQLAQSLGIPSPRNLASIEHHLIQWLPTRTTTPLSALLEREIDGFCKPRAGIEGSGAFSLRVNAGTLYLNRHPATLEQLERQVTVGFVLQERIVQHPELARLHPASINTLRVVTVHSAGTTRVFFTCLRTGVGGREVDNFSPGGLLIGVDPEHGRLRSRALVRGARLEWVTRHPDSGLVFDGFQVPFFHDALRLVCSFHDAIPQLHSIGWDVGFTPEGPTIIEGNDNWGARNLMVLEPDFGTRFRDLATSRH